MFNVLFSRYIVNLMTAHNFLTFLYLYCVRKDARVGRKTKRSNVPIPVLPRTSQISSKILRLYTAQ